jgi:hypothetical protein
LNFKLGFFSYSDFLDDFAVDFLEKVFVGTGRGAMMVLTLGVLPLMGLVTTRPGFEFPPIEVRFLTLGGV